MMLIQAKRLVIKVGSSLLIGDDNHVRKHWLAELAEDILLLHGQQKQVIIITSGAVALGRHVLGYGKRVLTLEEKQAAAAAGQAPLMFRWVDALQFQMEPQLVSHGLDPADKNARMQDWLRPAQVLLTAGDLRDRKRYLNARNTLEVLLDNPLVIPIINENDTVATAELRFGDNDKLAALVAQMLGADMLLLLSDIEGLYTADPRQHRDAEHKAVIAEVTPDIEAMAGGSVSGVGTGGMISKIAAAKIAMRAGCDMVIMNGQAGRPITRLLQGERHTLFKAKESPLSARKHWIAGSLTPAGSITVDNGAAQALHSGKSLLPAGVIRIEGAFGQGDAVWIKNMAGDTLGKGLIAYTAEDANRIMGKKSQQIEAILGFKRRDVLIHRDDMVLAN